MGYGVTETIRTVNLFLSERYTGSDYFTLFFGILNTETGVLEYVNAAHPPPILFNPLSENLKKLESTESILGIIKSEIHSRTLIMQPGERLYIYSDGVTETLNSQDKPYGYRRLHSFLISQRDQSVDEVSRNLKKELDIYRENIMLSDDTSFIALEYNPIVVID
jgi:sigma-B regulation protein RsbU (phosphoserine phosphatase)